MTFVRVTYLLGVLVVGASSARLLPFLTVADLFFGVATVGWLLLGAPGGASKRLLFNPATLGLVLFMAGALLSMTNSADVVGTAVNSFKFAFTFFAFFVLGPPIFRSDASYRILLITFAASIFVNLIGVAAQWYLGHNLFGVEADWGRYTGFSEHPNELGMHAALVLMVLPVLLKRISSRAMHLCCVVVALAAIICLLFAASMTAAIAVTCAALMFVLHSLSRGNVVPFATLCAACVAIVIVAGVSAEQMSENSLSERLMRQADSTVGDSTLGSRIDTYRLAFDRISENPLVGAGSSTSDSFLADGYNVHNIFLRGLYEGGMFALLGLVSIYAFVAFDVLRMVRKQLSGDFGVSLHCFFTCLVILVSLAPISIRRIAWVPFLVLLVPYFNAKAHGRRVTGGERKVA